jgi:NADPH2:quinone reductase
LHDPGNGRKGRIDMTPPSTITAVEISAPGGPEALRAVQRPMPTPKEDEVLIKVAAAGVNRPDVMQREGKYPPPPGASDIPGLEVAGEIVGLGPGVTAGSGGTLEPGARVCALLSGGGYASYAVAPAALCLPVPRGLSLIEAAALPETFFTVWDNLFTRGGLTDGESVLIHGGTSGIGTTAIQLAAARGARVFATAGSADKARLCERYGAARGIEYRSEDFVEVVRQSTHGKGVDVILDMIGGSYLARNIEALAVEGRLVIIASMGGGRGEINLNALMQKRLKVLGSTLRARSVALKAQVAAAVHHGAWPLIEAGRVRPVIHATFPLAQASEAHRLMESSQHVGKIVLTA